MPIHRAPLACVLLCLAGCHTNVSVRRVGRWDTSTPGLRYSLPKTIVKVIPKADGGVEVSTENVPDLENTFAIDAQTFLGTHTFEAQVDRGMLKSITYNSDSGAIAAQAVEATAGVTKTIVDKSIKDDEAREAKREARAQELKTLEGDVEELQKELNSLQATLVAHQTYGSSPDTIRGVQIQIAVSEANLAFAQEKLARARRERGLSATGENRVVAQNAATQDAAALAPGPCPNPPCRGATLVRGPMFYAVEHGPCGTEEVFLRAIPWPDGCVQPRHPTTEAPRPPKPKPPVVTFTSPDGTEVAFPAAARISKATAHRAEVTARLEALGKLAAADVPAETLSAVRQELALAEAAAVIARRPELVLVASRPIFAQRGDPVLKPARRDADDEPAALAREFTPRAVLLGPTSLQLTFEQLPPAGAYVLTVFFHEKDPLTNRDDEQSTQLGEASIPLVVRPVP